MRNMRLYNIYWHMIRRTENINNKDYEHYGGKGITICLEWRYSFQTFQDWALSNGYSDNLTIDRIDNEKGYSPDNCRWVTMLEQNRNKTDSIFVEYDGKPVSLGELSEKSGIHRDTLRVRIFDCGWSVERAITERVEKKVTQITYQGKTQSIRKWAKEFDIHHSTLSLRLRKGIPFHMAVGVV